MKKIRSIVLALIAASTIYSQQNQLPRLVADLQKNSSDRALRERIIKLALDTKPAPATPREAVEIQGAADYIVANAKSEADFAKAASVFEKAISLAPWNAAFYYNAAVMYEKGKMAEKALPNYEFYLLAAPNADDSTAVIRKVGAMKFARNEGIKELPLNCSNIFRVIDALKDSSIRAKELRTDYWQSNINFAGQVSAEVFPNVANFTLFRNTSAETAYRKYVETKQGVLACKPAGWSEKEESLGRWNTDKFDESGSRTFYLTEREDRNDNSGAQVWIGIYRHSGDENLNVWVSIRIPGWN